MFRNLLVPLDGSPMAEAALPAAGYLAQRLGARVNLLHIIEKRAPDAVHGQPHLQTPEEAERYLARVAQEKLPPDLELGRHVHAGDVSDVSQSISGHAVDMEDALVVMCTHGRSRLGSLLLGSVAQRVVGDGPAPVLLVAPEAPAFVLKRILVPLDGEAVHECGMPAAQELAKACGAEVRLLMVVPTPGTLPRPERPAAVLLPRTTQALLRIEHEEASDYLARFVACVGAGGVAVAADLRRGDPATAILDAAKTSAADLILLATHRKSGLDAFWSGSVAPRVASYAPCAVMLVPVSQ